MKVKSIGILAGIGGLALGTVVSSLGATVLLSNKDTEILKSREESKKLTDKIKALKAQSISDIMETTKAMGDMNEELDKASKKLSEAMGIIDNNKEDKEVIESLKSELGVANKQLREAHEQIATRVNEIKKLKNDTLNDINEFNIKLNNKDSEILRLKGEIDKLNNDIEKYAEVKEAMSIIKTTNNNLDEAKKLALEAEKQHKSLAKRISKNSKK